MTQYPPLASNSPWRHVHGYLAVWITTILTLGCTEDPKFVATPAVAPPTQPPTMTPTMTPALAALLDENDRQYDAEKQMLVTEFRSPGYHTRMKTGALVHPTRESLIYALGLLQRNHSGDVERATAIIRRVVALQDADLESRTSGVWPWLLEEPLAEMESPDLNWADFCASQLVHILIEHSEKLSPELQELMRASLRLAVQAIRQRDVQPGYTNIAILGGGVCAAAGEWLGDAELLAYGRRRLQAVVQHVQTEGGFSEYNSPTYSQVIIGECERTRHLVRDQVVRTAAETLWRKAWEEVAASYHPTTQQWSGPHSRTSQVRLQASTVQFLVARTGVEIQVHPSMEEYPSPVRYATVPAIACSADLLDHFRTPVDVPRETVRTFQRGRTPANAVIGTTWHSSDASLGSVNRSLFWTQCKPLIGYWNTEADRSVVFRVQFLHDGRDFASMGIRTAQVGSRTLSLVEPIQDRGDWHPSLDRPADGIFAAADLRLRLELSGNGTTAKSLGDGRYEMQAGKTKVVIHTMPGRFAGRAVTWSLDEHATRLDGICYTGEQFPFDFQDGIEVKLGFGVELLDAEESPEKDPPLLNADRNGKVLVEWNKVTGTKMSVETSPVTVHARSAEGR